MRKLKLFLPVIQFLFITGIAFSQSPKFNLVLDEKQHNFFYIPSCLPSKAFLTLNLS